MKNALFSLLLLVTVAHLPLIAVDVVTVIASDPSAAETGANTGTFVFNRSSAQTTALTVLFTQSGSATSGSDFTALATSVVIPANSTSATVTVTPIDDSTKEDPETVILTISANAAYTVGAPSVATVTIASNEQPTVTVSATDASMSEPGSDTGTIRFSRDVSLSTATVVTFTVSGTAISGSDFTSLGTTATIPPSNASSVSLTVTALDDALVEDAETLIVTVSPSSIYLVGTPSSATLTLTDNEVPTVTVTATDATAAETGGDTGTFTVTRSAAFLAPLTVSFSVSGTANSGSDFTSLGTSVVIPATAASTTVTVTPIDDATKEDPETVILTISANAAYTVGTPSVATVTIASNEQPTVTISATDATMSEPGTDTGTVRFSRDVSPSTATVVTFSVSGTATLGSDFVSLGTTATIPSNARSVSLTVTALDDALVEDAEMVIVTIASSSNYLVGTPSSATLTITDNEVPTVTVSATDATAAETGGDTGKFTVTRSAAFLAPLTVSFSVGGSATSGSDFTSLGLSVVIPATAASATVTVTPIDDATKEDPETVILTISPNAAYTVGTPSVATVTIASNEQPTVTISATDASLSEPGTNTGTIVFSRDVSPSTATVVTFTVGGTATSGSDFTSLGTTATIPASASSVSLTVTALDDALVESDETVVVTISPSSNYLVGTPSSATLTITDNELATVTVAATDAAAAEAGLDVGVFTISRGVTRATSLMVSYAVTGTATSGSDFTAIGTSAVIPANAASVTVTATPINDTTVEDPETIILTVSTSANYTVGSPSVATVTITSDDLPTVTVTATDAAAAEAALDPGTFTVNRGVALSTALTVSYSVSGTAMAGSDYTSLIGTVTIPASATTATVTVTPIDDVIAEDPETVILTIAADAAYAVGSPSAATVTITSDDLPTVTVTATDAAAAEAALDPGTFTVSRGVSLSSALTVLYVVSGTATAGGDYTTLSGTVTIPASATTATVTVTPVDDLTAEDPETVILTIAVDAAYTVGSPAAATVTITSDDLPTVTVTATDAAAAEAALDPGTFTVSRGVALSGALTVSYAVSGTATSGSDFASIGTSMIIPANAASATVVVTPIDDATVEDPETVILTVSTSASYLVGSPSIATVTITSDDLPTVTVTATDAAASEAGPDTGKFTISRGVALSAPLTVTYTTGGTATSGSDYASLGTSATILAGQSSVDLIVAPIDDALVEDAETVVFTLTANVAYAVGVPSAATVTIADNELPTITVILDDPAATEAGPHAGRFKISRGVVLSTTTVVTCTISGSAIAGNDYVALPVMVMIPGGESEVNIPVLPIDDAIAEDTETVVLTLNASPSTYIIGTPSTGTVTIADNDLPTVTVTATDAAAAEAGLDPGVFTVSRGVTLSGALTVTYTVSGSATAGSDYATLNGTVTIPASDMTATVTVTPIDDLLAEDPENVVIALAANPAAYVLGAPSTATVTITSDDLPTVTVTASDASSAEAGLDPGAFTISRGTALSSALTVSFTVAGEAAAGSDFVSFGTSAVIPANQSSVLVAVVPVNDAIAEVDEVVRLTLVTNAGYTVGAPSVASVVIYDDDLPTVSISPSDTASAEAGLDPGIFYITREISPTYETVVNYTVSGTATPGADYVALSGQVTITNGTTVAVTVTPIDDLLAEDPETVVITLTANPAAYVLGAPSTATVTIASDDLPTVSVVVTDAAASEAGLDPGVFTITRDVALSSPLTVSYAASGTATAGSDYTTLSGSVTIPAAEVSVSVSVTVTPIDDVITEGPETVILTVSPDAAYAVGVQSTATVTIADDDLSSGPPMITVQPANTTALMGAAATFSVTAVGANPLSYQWSRTTLGNDWQAIFGATGSTYTIPVTTLGDGGTFRQYRVVVTNSFGSVTSSSASLAFTPVAPTVTVQPANRSVFAGQLATFSVTATGTAPLAYQWNRSNDGGSTWAGIGGANGSTYSIITALSDSGAQFRVVVTNGIGSATSSPATLTVSSFVAPVITQQPQNKTAEPNFPATFTVVATGSLPLGYQWSRSNDGGITWFTLQGPAGGSGTYTTAATTLSDTGALFRVVVSNSAGSVTSAIAVLTVAAVAPSITVQPADRTVSEGAMATFSVTATGTAPLAYQWSRSNDGGGTWTSILGASGATYATAPTTVSDTGAQVRVLVSNGVGSATSSVATLSVAMAVPPSITQQPQDLTVGENQAATFSVTATGTALAYQWSRSNDGGGTWTAVLGASGTSYSYTTPPMAMGDTGAQFRVVVANSVGSVTSSAATLTVAMAVPPFITQQPQNQTVAENQSAIFTVVASGGSGVLDYIWSRSNDGGITWANLSLQGSLSPTYTTAPTTLSDTGAQFRVLVSSPGFSSVTSSAATLTVGGNGTAIVTVTTMGADAVVAEEGTLSGAFTVSRGVTLTTPTVVTYAISGTATAGSDYVPLSGTVTIEAGVQSAYVLVTPIDDTTVEDPETVILTVSTDASYTVSSPSAATVTIISDDVPSLTVPSVTTTTVTGITQAGGTSGGTVTADGGASVTARGVCWSAAANPTIANSTTSDGSGTGVFTSALTGLAANTLYHVRAYATNSAGTAYGADLTFITLTSNVLPTVVMTSPSTNAVFAAPANILLSANAVDADGTITQVEFLEGANSLGVDATSPYGVVWTNVSAGTYNVTARATDNNGGAATSSSITIIVVPAVTIVATNATSAEAGLIPGSFTVTRGVSAGPALTVNYAVSGSATSGSDYAALTDSVVISANASSAVVTVTPIDDTTTEDPETVVLTLSANPNYAVGAPSSATVTIISDDTDALQVVNVTATDATASEPGADYGVFVITRSGSTAANLIVNFSVSGTATAGADYTAIGTSATILTGSATTTVTVVPLDDRITESSENVILTIEPSADYAVGALNSDEVIIADDEPTTVSIVATDAWASEQPGDGGLFTVTRTGNISVASTVTLSITGTATAGSDYEPIGTTLSLPSGTASITVPVNVLPDEILEGPETVQVTLASGAGYTVGSPNLATVTIGAEVQFDVASSSGWEGQSPVIAIVLSSPADAPVTVTYSLSGTATNGGVDYLLPDGSLVFATGESTKTIVIPVRDDSLVESTETIVLTLSNPINASLGAISTRTHSIIDNDSSVVWIKATDSIAAEPADTGRFSISRGGPTTAPLTVNFTVSGTAVPGSDYTSPGTSVLIPAGASSASILVSPIDDTLLEGNETIIVSLATGAGYAIGPDNQATVWLFDDESVTIVATNPNAGEPSTNGAFTVTRSGFTVAAMTFFYSTGGSATPGGDYKLLSGSITMLPGVGSATILIEPIDDIITEGDENVVVTLTPNENYTVGLNSSATVIISDNEVPTITFAASDANADEAGGVGAFTVTRSGGTAEALAVQVAISGTAVNGSDYVPIPETVTFAIGQSSVVIPVIPIMDTVLEGTETVVLTLASGQTAASNGGSATVSIEDVAVTVVATDPIATEVGATTGTFTITRTGPTTTALSVPFTFEGTATVVDDYVATISPAIIAIGQSSVDVTITPVAGDGVTEGDETVTISLLSTGAYALSGSTATLTIIDTPTVTVVASDPVAAEGGGENGAFTVTRAGGDLTQPLSVSYQMSGSASTADYSPLSGTIIIPANSESAEVAIIPVNDGQFEYDETVVMTLTASATYVANAASATVTIVDLSIGAFATDLFSSESAGDTGQFTIRRTGSNRQALTVAYTMSGTATAGSDYTALSGSVTIAADQDEAVITLVPIDDAVSEPDEFARLTLTPTTGYAISPNYADIIIKDNDRPVVSIIATDAVAYEGTDPGEFTLSRTGSTASPLIVQIRVSGSANGLSGLFDYGGAPTGPVTIPAGQASLIMPINAINEGSNVTPEARREGIETAIFTLIPASEYQLDPAHSTATVEIGDSDVPTLTVSTSAVSVVEGQDFVITITGNANPDSFLLYGWSGSASDTSDYTTPYPYGVYMNASAISIPVHTIDNAICDGSRTLTFTLASAFYSQAIPEGANIGDPGNDSVTITILDDEKPTVNLSVTAALAVEGGANGEFVITRNGPTTNALPVAVSVSGSAIAGQDFIAIPAIATIPAGKESLAIAFVAIDDTEQEGMEWVYAYINSSPNYVLGNATLGVLNIRDNDVPDVTITASDDTASEIGGDQGAFILERTGSTNAGLEVMLAFYYSTASAGIDYQTIPSSVIIPAGSSVVTIPVIAIDDAIKEGPETVRVQLAATTHYQAAGPGFAMVTIVDDEMPQVSLVATDTMAAEAGGDIGVITVTRTGATSDPLVVVYAVSGTATPGSDYVTLTGTITIPTTTASAAITIQPLDDAVAEGTETVVVTLIAKPSDYSIGSSPQAVVKIQDDEVPTVTIVATDGTAGEGVIPDVGTFTVTRTGATTAALSVALAWEGTAVMGQDYLSMSSSVLIPAGSVSAMLTVTPIDDTEYEGSETVDVRAVGLPTYNDGSPSTASMTIADNDLPTIGVIAADAVAIEAGGDNGQFIVTRSGITTGSLTVAYAIAGSATSGSDYQALTGSLIIPVGSASAVIPVIPINDTINEGVETVEITLTASASYLIDSSSAIVTIYDDEQSIVTLATTDTSISEDGINPGQITVTRSGPLSPALVVSYSIAGNATNGLDYAFLTGSLTIPANAASATIAVTPLEDVSVEGPETVEVTLAMSSSYQVGLNTSVTIQITDNDLPEPQIDAFVVTSPTTMLIYGSIPAGFGITGVTVALADPVSGVDVALDYIDDAIFMVRATSTAGSSAVLNLNFTAPGLTGPTASYPLAFKPGATGDSNGSGGGGVTASTGAGGGLDPSQIRPVAPTVEVTIQNDSLTGDLRGTLNGEEVNFTSHSSVTCTIHVTPRGVGAVSEVLLFDGNGRSFNATDGVATITGLTEGRYEISAQATVTNGGMSATGSSATVVLMVDKTPPSLSWILAAKYQADPSIVEPLRHSLDDERKMVFLNGTSEAVNQLLRKVRGMNVFDRAGFQVDALVSDATGVSKTLAQTAIINGTDVTVAVQDATETTPQRVKLSGGFGSLRESIYISPETLALVDNRGSYELKTSIQDRCGNQDEYKPWFRVWVDVTAPQVKVGTIPYQGSKFAIGGENGNQTQISPGRYVVSTFDAADAWQNSFIVLNTALRRLAGSPEGLPKGTTQNLSAWLLSTPVKLPKDNAGMANIVMMDFSGNVTGNGTPVEVAFTRKPITEFKADDAQQRGVNGPSEQPIYRLAPASPNEDMLYWLFEGGTGRDLSLHSKEGVREVSKVKDVITVQNSATAKYTAILVNPLDVGPDDNTRHVIPQIISIPPTWNPAGTNQDVRVKDEGLREFIAQLPYPSGNIVLGSRRPGFGGGNAFDNPQSASGNRYDDKTLQASFPVKRNEFDPGLTRVGYSLNTSSTVGGSAPLIPYSSITGFRWLNVIKIDPDVIVTGSRATLRLEAGFLDDNFKVNDFDPKGDYVRFVGSGNITQAASAWNPTALPASREDKIAIVSQRLVASSQNSSIKQVIELEVEIGAKVDPATVNVDVKCGRVKSYTDDLSQPNAGPNGDHRMKDSLKIIKPDIVPTVPKYAECLHKRSGKADEPVIIINSGGDKTVNNCSLVGYEEGGRNVWSFTAKFDSPIFEGDPGTYSVAWDVDGGQVTSGSAVGSVTISVKYRAGRYEPTLRVYRTVSNRRTLIGTASIHSINVYSGSVDGSEWKDAPVAEDDRYGSETKLDRNADQSVDINVRALVDVKAQGACRARISSDGYPQNEYWVTSADSGDLPQPYTFKPKSSGSSSGGSGGSSSGSSSENSSRKGWTQGYGDPSPSDDNLSVRVRSSKSYAEDTTSAKFSTIMVKAGVDRNRNQMITFDEADRTSPLRPHVFWTNSNRDIEPHDALQQRKIPQDANPADGPADSTLGAIGSVRDLQDWMRLTAKAVGAVSSNKLLAGTLKLRLRTTGGLGFAYVKVADDNRPDGLGYLMTEPGGQKQKDVGVKVERFDQDQRPVVDKALWIDDFCPLLIEGTKPGSGRIICEILENGRVVGRANVFIKLAPISKLYEHWTVGDTTERGAVIQDPPALTGDSARYGEDEALLSSPANKRGIAFVHGWRMEPWERRAFAESALKRLYWAGYTGKFALFSWPTEYMNINAFWSDLWKPINGDVRNYDRSELQARKTGRTQFASWVKGRKDAWKTNAFDVMAHSMGNIVVCEALRGFGGINGTMCDNYYSCQSAEIGHAVLDEAALIATRPAPEIPVFWPSSTSSVIEYTNFTVSLEKQKSYIGPNLHKYALPRNPREKSNGDLTGGDRYHKGIGGRCDAFINCYNDVDTAMGSAVANQLYKPDVGYSYEFKRDKFNKNMGNDQFARTSLLWFDQPLVWPKDDMEILSFIAQAQSVCMGAVDAAGGEMTSVVKLSDKITGLGKEHSAQFTLATWQSKGFWNMIKERQK